MSFSLFGSLHFEREEGKEGREGPKVRGREGAPRQGTKTFHQKRKTRTENALNVANGEPEWRG